MKKYEIAVLNDYQNVTLEGAAAAAEQCAKHP